MSSLNDGVVVPDASEGLAAEMDDLTAEMRETTRRTRAKYGELIDEERPASRRPRMPVAERAKQFAPFAALKKR